MDRNFHSDDFERLLREKSDEFRMYPSKRIWHSIYNNIHPGRKWPSVAMTITLITALFLTGYLNTKNANPYTESGKNPLQQKVIGKTAPALQTASAELTSQPLTGSLADLAGTREASATNKPRASVNNLVEIAVNDNNPGAKSLLVAGIPLIPKTIVGENTSSDNASAVVVKVSPVAIANSLNGMSFLPGLMAVNTEATAGDEASFGNDQAGGLAYSQKTLAGDFIAMIPVTEFADRNYGNKITVKIEGGNSAVEKNKLAVNKRDLISAEDRAWIENYALYNRPATKKWANKLAWQLYATPSVIYRSLSDDINFGNTLNAPPFAISASSQDINKAVNQKPSIGLEIGTGFLYSISKIVKLKTGLQLNYTRYNAEAFQNTHPVATKLTMHDYQTNVSYEEIRTTPYSNKSGVKSIKLHNETFQVSLPIGADVKLIGNDNLQWSFGATIQPTYVFGGKSYLISSDRRNYIKESSMLNNWNLNAGFETFISYKAPGGIIFQLGPQFRTQLFTTNHKQIAVEEKLNSYGLKFGISKTIK